MANLPKQSTEKLSSLALPLTNVGAEFTISAQDLMDKGIIFGNGKALTEHQDISPRIEGAIIHLGGLSVLSGRTTPIQVWEEESGASTITMCYAGAPCYQDSDGRLEVEPGDILIVPRNGGRISTGYLSSINLPIDHQRLHRTMRAMQCDSDCIDLGRALVLAGSHRCQQAAATGGLFSFFSWVDSLLSEDRHIAIALGLDEQIYRLLALALMRSSGDLERIQRRWMQPTNAWSNPLDELVDYIRSHAHRDLTLTDLEEQSHYSARHLQNLFKEKFDCTPMQFVRRQRLTAAMEKLRAADPDDTVTRIARDSGYRFTSNFSTDFQRQFGIRPSAVLRAARATPPQQS
ncbi:MAG: AraC family transcriptional regulator [Cyanobacteriota bacterium]|nr:AraC family transcriptional regulator [Cyanobacteriota bacterium]